MQIWNEQKPICVAISDINLLFQWKEQDIYVNWLEANVIPCTDLIAANSLTNHQDIKTTATTDPIQNSGFLKLN